MCEHACTQVCVCVILKVNLDWSIFLIWYTPFLQYNCISFVFIYYSLFMYNHYINKRNLTDWYPEINAQLKPKLVMIEMLTHHHWSVYLPLWHEKEQLRHLFPLIALPFALDTITFTIYEKKTCKTRCVSNLITTFI